MLHDKIFNSEMHNLLISKNPESTKRNRSYMEIPCLNQTIGSSSHELEK